MIAGRLEENYKNFFQNALPLGVMAELNALYRASVNAFLTAYSRVTHKSASRLSLTIEDRK
jgi:hypothetical protein